MNEQQKDAIVDVRETLKPSEPRYYLLRIIRRLIDQEAIKLHPDLNMISPSDSDYFRSGDGKLQDAYVLDLDKSASVIDKFFVENPKDAIVPSTDLLDPGRSAFKKIVKYFTVNNIIPTSLAVEVGKIIRPSGFRPTKGNDAGFYYFKEVFPENPAERGTVRLGERYVYLMSKNLARIFSNLEINCTQDQLRDIVLRSVIAHEYGHAVKQTIVIMKLAEMYPNISPENLKRFAFALSKQIDQTIYEIIAPNHELTDIFSDEPNTLMKSDSSEERLAQGFEYLGLQSVLKDLGITEDKIQLVLEAFRKIDHDRFIDHKHLIEYAKKHGLNLRLLQKALSRLMIELDTRGRGDLSLCLMTNYGPNMLGYAFALTPHEIQKFIAMFLPKNYEESPTNELSLS